MSDRTPFGEVPYPGTPPVNEPPIQMHHEIVKTDLERQEMECACGLMVQGPDFDNVMQLHIMEENAWEE